MSRTILPLVQVPRLVQSAPWSTLAAHVSNSPSLHQLTLVHFRCRGGDDFYFGYGVFGYASGFCNLGAGIYWFDSFWRFLQTLSVIFARFDLIRFRSFRNRAFKFQRKRYADV